MRPVKILLPKGGYVQIDAVPDDMPLGPRGKRPCHFYTNPGAAEKVRQLEIPGVITRGASITCALDAAPVIAELLGAPGLLDQEIKTRALGPLPMHGRYQYDALNLKAATDQRAYQKPAISFLLHRAYALLADPPRAGKTLATIGAAILLGSGKRLIVCPSLAKYVWASEIAKWAKEDVALLFGRGGTEARIWCRACEGTGRVVTDDGRLDQEGQPFLKSCMACRAANGQSLGEKVITVKQLVPVMKRDEYKVTGTRTNKKGEEVPTTRTKYARYSVYPPSFVCTRHLDVTATQPGVYCSKCREVLHEALENVNWVVCNYDLLAAQKDTTTRGVEFMREDLPGWSPVLARFKFTLCIADEAHHLRGWQGAKEAVQRTRRQRFIETVDSIDRVWALTATPIYGFVRDLFGILDAISRGLWS